MRQTFDPREVAARKATLRAELKRRALEMECLRRESAAICRALLVWEPLRSAKCWAGFMPTFREPQIQPLLEDALRTGKTLLLPRAAYQSKMVFCAVDNLKKLVSGSFGVLEPAQGTPEIPLAAADLLLVPLEAVDACGNRLGKGGGYYDRALKEAKGLRLGIAFSWQVLKEIPTMPHDEPLHGWADSTGIHLLGHNL